MKTNNQSRNVTTKGLLTLLIGMALGFAPDLAHAQTTSYVLADYYYPFVAGNEWRYSGTDYSGDPGRRIARVDSVSTPVTAWTGRSNPQSYVTNLVQLFAAYAPPNSLTPFDDWQEYFKIVNGRVFYWGGDDDGEAVRVDGGAPAPISLAVGQLASVTRDLYDSVTFLGSGTLKFQLISAAPVTVPAGTFNDCIQIRITLTAGGESNVSDEWWAKGVGMIKHRNVPDDGADQNDLEFYQVVSPVQIASGPVSRTNNLGTTATFSATVVGSAPLAYIWKKDGTNLVNSARISGVTTTTLTILDVGYADAGSYTLAVSNNVSGAVSAPAALIVKELFPPSLSVTSHTDLQWLASASATVSGTASDSGFGDSGIGSVTINGVRAANDTGAGGATANWSRLQSLTPGTNTLRIIARDGQGNATTNVLRLISDVARPTVAFTSPANGLKVFNPAINVTGKAADSLGVAAVFIQRNGGAWTQVSGTTSWNSALLLEPGLNTLKSYSVDIAGNTSLTNSITVTYGVLLPLTLAVEGSGTILGATNGQLLEIGRQYKLTAKAATRNLHVGWSDDTNSTSSVFAFLMHSNASFTAHFVTNPFVGLKGKFNGLFREDAPERRQDNSGAFTLVVTEPGTYSTSVQIGAKKFPGKGRFDWLGKSQFTFKPSIGSTVTVSLELDVTNLTAKVNGNVTDGVWESPLVGDRAPVYPRGSASPFAGKYTMVIPGGNNAALLPGGDGYGLVSITPAGVLKLAGKLADATTAAQTIPVSTDGWWPVYVPLYTGKGSLHGWLQVTNGDNSEIAGTLSWIKLTNSTAKFYRGGFTNEHNVVGSGYVPPTTNRVINMTNGTVEFRLGNLLEPITNHVLLTANNKITNLSSNKLTMTLTTTSGLFTGSVTDTSTSKAIPFNGTLLQKLDSGYGHFYGTNQSGQVVFRQQE